MSDSYRLKSTFLPRSASTDLSQNSRKKSEKYVGKTVEILCEDYDEKKGLYLGRDEFGRMGYFKSEKDVIGQFIKLHVTRANGISLFGEMEG